MHPGNPEIPEEMATGVWFPVGLEEAEGKIENETTLEKNIVANFHCEEGTGKVSNSNLTGNSKRTAIVIVIVS